MFGNTRMGSKSFGNVAVAAAMIACAGQAVGDNAVGAKSVQVSRWLEPTEAQRAEVRATFRTSEKVDAPAKVVPESHAFKVERKHADWPRVKPEVPAGLRDAELPTHYVYEGKPIVMNVDTSRIAVKFAGIDAKTGDELVRAAAERLGVRVAKIVSNGVGNWRFIQLTDRLNDNGAVSAVIDLLTTDPSFEFASPVFEHPTIAGGYVLITPEINVRVAQPLVANSAAVLKTAAPQMRVVNAELGGLPGAYQVMGSEKNGFRVLRAANQLTEDASIAWAEPDMVSTMKLDYVPNDDFWATSGMWGWDQANDIDTDAGAAWDLTKGNPSMRVLVMDVGVEQNHPDINQLAGRDFTTGAAGGIAGGGPAGSCDRHGTSVAGIISGRINNGIGGAGVCPNCRVLSAKTATEDTSPCASTYAAFSGSWLANAINWGISQNCLITNSSFGVGASATVANAYDDAQASGLINFASAGNGGSDNIGDPTLGYPSSLASVQAVAAIDSDGGRSNFSNWGVGLQFACPGTNVLTCDRQGALGYNSGSNSDYASFGGTSAASPFCAGVCALVWSALPEWAPATILSLMRTSCRDLGAAGYDTGYGWGLPNANFALRFPGPNNMWCDEATSIGAWAYNPGTYSTAGANAVIDERQEDCESGDVGVSHSVWYSFVPPCAGTLDINTNGSDYDTVLSVFRGSCTSSTQVACDDDSGTGTQSQLTSVAVTSGLTYLIKVSAYGTGNAGGTLDFNFEYTPTPPTNDLCSDATTIAFEPWTSVRCTVGASNQVCEASGGCVTDTSKSVWWEYTPTVNGRADIDTNGSGYDTVLSVWTGCPIGLLFNGNLTCLSGTALACNDDGGDGTNSMLTGVAMRKGRTYKIKAAAYGASAAGGDLVFHFAYRNCPADHNGSGAVSVQDIFDFLTDYFAGNIAADYNTPPSGTVTVQDIFDYLALYFAGQCE